jgi:predicted RNase H-like HicB family nuclease
MSGYCYAIVLERDKHKDGDLFVHTPAFPEICTEGDTDAEAKPKDAIQLVIASKIEHGEDIPISRGHPVLREIVAEVA